MHRTCVFGRELSPSSRASSRALVAITCTLLLSPHPTRGTTMVMMSDADLVHSSSAIVLGRVQAISTGAAAADHIETRIGLVVQEQLKGRRRQRVIFTIPGGTAQGLRRVIFGVPQFFVGERVLVLLRSRPDGRLTLTALSMGKFTVVETALGERAHRQLGGATTLTFNPQTRRLAEVPQHDDRALASLLATLRQLAAQGPPAPSTSPESTSLVGATASRWGDAFTFMGPPPARWEQPDSGAPVTYVVDRRGDATIGAAASQTAVAEALAAWSTAGASVRLRDGGPATPAPFNPCDGASTVEFNDPFGEIGPPRNCGGVLAVGGFCSTDTGSSTVNGVAFQRITEGDVTVNTGFAGCDFWTATNLAEILTHEFGHTLGLAHSSENPHEINPLLHDATMYYLAHFDGRGASLRADDMAGIQALYPVTPAPPAFNPIRLRRLTLNPTAAELVMNAIIHFPSVSFTPSRDSLAVSLSDGAGLQYTGSVARFAVRPWSRGPARYVGELTGPNGLGLALFSWSHDTSAALILRVTGPAFAAPPNNQIVLSLTFGQQTFTKQVALQSTGDGAWVPQ